MTLRFRRRVRIFQGVHLNVGMHGVGLSVGPRGLHVGLNRQGMYTSVGIPGTGIYAMHHVTGPDLHPRAGDARGVLVGIAAATALLAVMLLARC